MEAKPWEGCHDYDDTLQPVTIGEVIMDNVVAAGQASIRAGIPKETGT